MKVMKKRFIFLGLICSIIASCDGANINPSEGLLNDNLTLSNTTEYKEAKSTSAIGNKKFLVIPFEFEGERQFQESDLEKIRKAFFEPNLSTYGNAYYSLTEYYEKSSLGKVHISGDVAPVLKVPHTVDELTKDGNYFPGVPAYEYLNNAGVSDEYLSSFDQDKDGYVDAVVFVYSSQTSERSGNFWAWVSTFNAEANIARPQFARHMWVGLDFFSTSSYEIDAHTIIHETGHLFGLRDYYPSDNYNVALGGHSMMDYNISDHDPYSKMLLSWLDPIYYDFKNYKKVTLNLKTFEENNQVLLLNNFWNHSVMDEYLLIEYYTPTGLNELDAKNKYDNRPIGFSKNGIKIYHVDSRIAKCHYDKAQYAVKFDEYVNEIPESYDSDIYYLIGASNNNEDSRTDASRQGRYKQVALIENKQYNKLQAGENADDDSLFYEGDVFDSSTSPYLLNGNWNNGTSINFTISVDKLTSEYATLTISYKGE